MVLYLSLWLLVMAFFTSEIIRVKIRTRKIKADRYPIVRL